MSRRAISANGRSGHGNSAHGGPGIPEATIARLPVYLRVLYAFAEQDIPTVSSEELAAAAGVNSAKLRKDLSHLGSYGIRGVGYDVEYLVYQVSRALGLTQNWPVVIVGAGNLGRALAHYGGFVTRGFQKRSLVICCDRKGNTKRRALSRGRFQFYGAGMHVDDPARDGQAEAIAALGFAGARRVGAVKAFKHVRGIFRRDADSGVLNLYHGAAIDALELHGDLSTGRRVLYGVFKDHQKDALHSGGIGVHPSGRRRKLLDELNAFAGGQDGGLFARAPQMGNEVDALEMEIGAASIGPRESQKVFNELRSFDGGRQDSRERFTIFLRATQTPQGQFRVGANDRDRSAQIVRSVGRELGDAPDRGIDSREHFVQGLAEAAKFIVGFGNDQAFGEILRVDFARALNDLIYG